MKQKPQTRPAKPPNGRRRKETAPNWKRPSRPPQKPRNRPKPCKRNWEFSKVLAGAKFALLFEDVQQKAAAIMDLADEMRDGGQQELRTNSPAHWPPALRALADQAEGGEA